MSSPGWVVAVVPSVGVAEADDDGFVPGLPDAEGVVAVAEGVADDEPLEVVPPLPFDVVAVGGLGFGFAGAPAVTGLTLG
jgi:hypothetical protein